ncbi:hypothetical protein BDV10DRAFT_174869, partial [Aspergillus recurvatus]
MSPKSDLLNTITIDKTSHIALLQAFVRAPSPNPPGDTTAAATVLTDYLTSQNIPNYLV